MERGKKKKKTKKSENNEKHFKKLKPKRLACSSPKTARVFHSIVRERMLQLKSLQVFTSAGLQVGLRHTKPTIFKPSSTF